MCLKCLHTHIQRRLQMRLQMRPPKRDPEQEAEVLRKLLLLCKPLPSDRDPGGRADRQLLGGRGEDRWRRLRGRRGWWGGENRVDAEQSICTGKSSGSQPRNSSPPRYCHRARRSSGPLAHHGPHRGAHHGSQPGCPGRSSWHTPTPDQYPTFRSFQGMAPSMVFRHPSNPLS